MEQKKDYYKILGLSEDDKKLPKDEFLKKERSQFKKMAIKWHPDRNPGNKEAEEKFKDVNEAHQTLSDYDGKKAEYDNPMSGFQFSGGMSMDEILKHFNMDFGGFEPFGRHQQQSYQPQKGQTIRGSVTVTLEDILNSCEKKIRYKKQKVCHSCNGTGKGPHTTETICPHCHGAGVIVQAQQTPFGYVHSQSTCPHCHGAGKIVKDPCPTCNGSGYEMEIVEQTITLPKGIRHGMAFTVEKVGHEVKDGETGDIVITVNEAPHDRFVREGSALRTQINVDAIDAILGCKKRVKTLSGEYIEVDIRPGIQEKDEITVMGKGLPELNTNRYGALICRVHITIPTDITTKQKKLLEKFKKENG